jgi:hypothetical protein
MAIVLLGTVIVAGSGTWLLSRAQPTSDATTVTATAVVVTSLACTDGLDGTLVDVTIPSGPQAGTPVRASLDACGYQEGQQIAVQFAEDDPTAVTLAGVGDTDLVAGGNLLPLGLGVAGLLGLGAVLAVLIDSRRAGRRRPLGQVVAGRPADADTLIDDVSLESLLTVGAPTLTATGATPVGPLVAVHGRHSLPDDDEATAFPPSHVPAASAYTVVRSNTSGSGLARPVPARSAGTASGSTASGSTAFPPLVPTAAGFVPAGPAVTSADGLPGELSAVQVLTAPSTGGWTFADWVIGTDDATHAESAENGLTSIDLSFPSTSTLAASLHDELFTHRSAAS